MALSKEQMRKYQSDRRDKLKKSSPSGPIPVVNLPPDNRFNEIEARLKFLEEEFSAFKGAVSMADSVKQCKSVKQGKVDMGLFSRVVDEKDRRLRGV